jgi:hypothetical protein
MYRKDAAFEKLRDSIGIALITVIPSMVNRTKVSNLV